MEKEVKIEKFCEIMREAFVDAYGDKGLEATVFDEKIWPVLWYNLTSLTFKEVMQMYFSSSSDFKENWKEGNDLYFERLWIIARETIACDIGQKATRDAFGNIGRNNPTKLSVAFEIYKVWLDQHAAAAIEAWRDKKPCPNWDDIEYPSGIGYVVEKGGEQ